MVGSAILPLLLLAWRIAHLPAHFWEYALLGLAGLGIVLHTTFRAYVSSMACGLAVGFGTMVTLILVFGNSDTMINAPVKLAAGILFFSALVNLLVSSAGQNKHPGNA